MQCPTVLVGRRVALLGWIGWLRRVALSRIGLSRVGLWGVALTRVSRVGGRVVRLHLSWVGLLWKTGREQ